MYLGGDNFSSFGLIFRLKKIWVSYEIKQTNHFKKDLKFRERKESFWWVDNEINSVFICNLRVTSMRNTFLVKSRIRSISLGKYIVNTFFLSWNF